MNIIKKQITWEGQELILETGRMATQASGSVFASYGNTQVLATVVADSKTNLEIDFVPLSVHYLEKYYAVGRIPGGFFKREGKPSERETLISRLIDRPIRPTIHKDFKNEIQIIITVLSFDNETDTEIVSLVAASAALAISGVQTTDIVAAAKIAMVDDNIIVNPKVSQVKGKLNKLDLIVAGTKDGILMVESEAHELSEEQMLEALDKGFNSFQPIISFIEDFKNSVNTPIISVPSYPEEHSKLVQEVFKRSEEDLKKAFAILLKQERKQKIESIKENLLEELKKEFSEELLNSYFNTIFKDVEKDVVRSLILNEGKRIDNRSLTEIRKITSEIDVVSMTHGSALFTRGETQALVLTTLGSEEDEQIVDDISGDSRDKFVLHYNFPPFSVGEVGRVGAPGRREIGHGKLAFRAINPLMPNEREFPYAIRVVSEVLGSNGSSSMATVCGTCLSLMAAGVPIKKPVAGIAMGLIKEDSKYAILSDILGDEDHLGDMDFKVAGTKDGITALQMDLKITSINQEIMKKALEQAKEGRIHILNEITKVISEPRKELSKFAPKIKVIAINKDKVSEVIGAGGKIIKGLINAYDVKINVKDNGIIKIYGTNEENVNKALRDIASIVVIPEVGKVYNGKVVKILEFGAFINIVGTKDGFLHISEITDNRNADIKEFMKLDDIIKVKVIKIDDSGKIRLSTKGIV